MVLSGKEINALEAMGERVSRLEGQVQDLNRYNERLVRDFNRILHGLGRVVEDVKEGRRE